MSVIDRPDCINIDWDNSSSKLCKMLGADVWNAWLSHLQFVETTSDSIVFTAPNAFIAQWIQNNYSDCIRQVTGKDVVIKERTANDESGEQSQEKNRSIDPSGTIQNNHTSNSHYSDTQRSTLNKDCVFDNFIVGHPNLLAFEVVKKLTVDYPSVPYTPIYIQGKAGVGKTHLMHAAGWKLSELGASVLYMSSGQFLERFVQSVRERNVQAFSSELTSRDVILIDDFQFLIGKEKTQEEFFNILNTIVGANKIIIISSDQLPSQFDELHERMKTRLSSGMTVAIHAPDYELRLSVLQAWAAHFPQDALDMMAKLDISIRELKGALTRVTVQADLMKMPITSEYIATVLHDLVTSSGFAPTMDEILNAILAYSQKNMTKVTKDQIRMSGRTSHIVLLRQIFMYLSHEQGGVNLSKIGVYLNGRDRTTVRHGIGKIRDNLRVDRSLNEMIKSIQSMLGI